MTRAQTPLWGRATSAVTVLLALLTACGGDGDAPASTSYGIETLMPALAKAVGSEDYVHLGIGDHRGRGEVQVDLSWADGEHEFRALTGDEPGEFLEFRRVNGRVYVGGEATGNHWTYLPDDDPRAMGEEGFDAGAAPVLLTLDIPRDYEALVDAVDKVDNQGEEELSGVSSTHYVVTVDSETWHSALHEQSIHRQIEVEEALVIDLWIDEKSLPVRLEYSGTGNTDHVRVDYSNWGGSLAVVEPEDAEPVGSEAS